MAHHHPHDDTYFLDQICMVALAGAFGVICLSLYFVQRPMLYLLLGTQFHPFVLASGITLLAMALIRASMLWSLAGAQRELADGHVALETASATGAACEHDHGHSHGHAHSHADAGHSHAHGHHDHGHSHSHADAGHDHAHGQEVIAQSRAFGQMPAAAPAPSHGHSHAHSHGGHDDHDHGWAPWRYVVLLVPIILFMLGLPNRPPAFNLASAAEVDRTADTIEEAKFHLVLAASAGDYLTPLGLVLARLASDADTGAAEYKNVKDLELMAGSAASREYYKNRTVQSKGQYVKRNDRYFELVRFKMQCCASDAMPIRVPVLAKESIVADEKLWVEVTGRVDFRKEAGGQYRTVLLVTSAKQVRPCNPDINPYID